MKFDMSNKIVISGTAYGSIRVWIPTTFKIFVGQWDTLNALSIWNGPDKKDPDVTSWEIPENFGLESVANIIKHIFKFPQHITKLDDNTLYIELEK